MQEPNSTLTIYNSQVSGHQIILYHKISLAWTQKFLNHHQFLQIYEQSKNNETAYMPTRYSKTTRLYNPVPIGPQYITQWETWTSKSQQHVSTQQFLQRNNN